MLFWCFSNNDALGVAVGQKPKAKSQKPQQVFPAFSPIAAASCRDEDWLLRPVDGAPARQRLGLRRPPSKVRAGRALRDGWFMRQCRCAAPRHSQNTAWGAAHFESVPKIFLLYSCRRDLKQQVAATSGNDLPNNHSNDHHNDHHNDQSWLGKVYADPHVRGFDKSVSVTHVKPGHHLNVGKNREWLCRYCHHTSLKPADFAIPPPLLCRF